MMITMTARVSPENQHGPPIQKGAPAVEFAFPREKPISCSLCFDRGFFWVGAIAGKTPIELDEQGRGIVFHKKDATVYFPCECQIRSEGVSWFTQYGHKHPPANPFDIFGKNIPNPAHFYAKLLDVINNPRSTERIIAVRYAKKLFEMFAKKTVESQAFPEKIVESPAFAGGVVESPAF
jgi:hypothetical protein